MFDDNVSAIGCPLAVMKLPPFVRRNLVLIVCIPTIVALHYSWYGLQFNEHFVSKQDREQIKVGGLFSVSRSQSGASKD